MRLKFLKAPVGGDFGIPEEFGKEMKEYIPGKETGKIGLFSSVQYMPYWNQVKKELEEKGYEVVSAKAVRTGEVGQLLGCDSYKDTIDMDFSTIDGFVYVGDGDFHPNALLLAQEEEENIKPVVIVGVGEGRVRVIDQETISSYLKKRKANLAKFYTSSIIGVFVTTKWGQQYKKAAMELKEKYPDKAFYYFIGDNFAENEMENFPYIQCWVNTACPRIGQDDITRIDKPLVNIKDIWK